MTLGYVEDLTAKYFMKQGYLVNQNVWFQVPKKLSGKGVAGWSDIDIFALAPGESLIIQCKSFIGTEKAEIISQKIIKWFEYVIDFLQKDDMYRHWIQGTKMRKILVVDWTVKKAETILKANGIEILYYEDLLKKLIRLLKKGEKRKGKEDDPTLRMLCAMIDKGIINKEILE